MELKEGMYVRTKKGIAKITKFDDLDKVAWTDKKNIYFGIYRPSGKINFELYDDGTVLNVSNEPIELIEDEDIAVIEYYVSKYRQRITRIFECSLFKNKESDFVIFENKHCNWWYDKAKKEWVNAKGYNPKIKSIVTKEQFEAIKYEIKN